MAGIHTEIPMVDPPFKQIIQVLVFESENYIGLERFKGFMYMCLHQSPELGYVGMREGNEGAVRSI